MEKSRFSLFSASLLIIVLFATNASALPVFSRQTGMACSACHFQHFPLLNGFGRAFKSAGYLMIGAQGKVEGEGLSIPNTLNMGVLAAAGYEKTNQNGGKTPAKTTGDGSFYVPGTGGELSVFVGGRVGDNAGFLAEYGSGGEVLGATISNDHKSAKLLMMYEVPSGKFGLGEGARAGVIPFSTDDHGASYAFELLNTGANVTHLMSGVPGLNGAHRMALSAQQYLGTNSPATGVAFVANSPSGFVNFTKYNQTGITGGALGSLGSTYLRLAWTSVWGSWDAGAGIQIWSGRSALYVPGSTVPGPAPSTSTYVYADTKAEAIDAQLQGNMGSIPVGFYASYATAKAGTENAYNYDPASLLTTANIGTAGSAAKSALSMSAEVGVIPNTFTLGVALRFGKSGVKLANDNNASDNAIMLVGTYMLAQNMMASLSLTNSSGGYWDSPHQNALGSTTTSINLLTLF